MQYQEHFMILAGIVNTAAIYKSNQFSQRLGMANKYTAFDPT